MASIRKRAHLWLKKSTQKQRQWIKGQLLEARSNHPEGSNFLGSDTYPTHSDLIEYFSKIEDSPEVQDWLTRLQTKWRDEKRRAKGGIERLTVSLPIEVWKKIETYRKHHDLNKSDAVLDYLMESGVRTDAEVEERIKQTKEQSIDKLKTQVAARDKKLEALNGKLGIALQANDRLTSSYESLTYLLSEYKARFGEEGLEAPLSKEEIEKQKIFYQEEIKGLSQINGLRQQIKDKFTRF